MIKSTAFAAALGALFLLPAPPAEAARCPLGKIYRTSLGVCWTEKQMRDAGFRAYRGDRATRSRAKVSRSVRYRAQKPPRVVRQYVEAPSAPPRPIQAVGRRSGPFGEAFEEVVQIQVTGPYGSLPDASAWTSGLTLEVR